MCDDLINFNAPIQSCLSLHKPLIPPPKLLPTEVEPVFFNTSNDSDNPFDMVFQKTIEYEQNKSDPFEIVLQNGKGYNNDSLITPTAVQINNFNVQNDIEKLDSIACKSSNEELLTFCGSTIEPTMNSLIDHPTFVNNLLLASNKVSSSTSSVYSKTGQCVNTSDALGVSDSKINIHIPTLDDPFNLGFNKKYLKSDINCVANSTHYMNKRNNNSSVKYGILTEYPEYYSKSDKKESSDFSCFKSNCCSTSTFCNTSLNNVDDYLFKSNDFSNEISSFNNYSKELGCTKTKLYHKNSLNVTGINLNNSIKILDRKDSELDSKMRPNSSEFNEDNDFYLVASLQDNLISNVSVDLVTSDNSKEDSENLIKFSQSSSSIDLQNSREETSEECTNLLPLITFEENTSKAREQECSNMNKKVAKDLFLRGHYNAAKDQDNSDALKILSDHQKVLSVDSNNCDKSNNFDMMPDDTNSTNNINHLVKMCCLRCFEEYKAQDSNIHNSTIYNYENMSALSMNETYEPQSLKNIRCSSSKQKKKLDNVCSKNTISSPLHNHGHCSEFRKENTSINIRQRSYSASDLNNLPFDAAYFETFNKTNDKGSLKNGNLNEIDGTNIKEQTHSQLLLPGSTTNLENSIQNVKHLKVQPNASSTPNTVKCKLQEIINISKSFDGMSSLPPAFQSPVTVRTSEVLKSIVFPSENESADIDSSEYKEGMTVSTVLPSTLKIKEKLNPLKGSESSPPIISVNECNRNNYGKVKKLIVI